MSLEEKAKAKRHRLVGGSCSSSTRGPCRAVYQQLSRQRGAEAKAMPGAREFGSSSEEEAGRTQQHDARPLKAKRRLVKATAAQRKAIGMASSRGGGQNRPQR